MARIKLVLNERRLALINAQEQVRADLPAEETTAPEGSLFEEETSAPTPAETRT